MPRMWRRADRGAVRSRGGAAWVGHKLLNVEQCKSCRRGWVKGTVQPGGTRVIVYLVAGIVLGLIVGVLFVILRNA